MPLNLIQGPPNSGRRGLIRERFIAAMGRDPVLVVPNLDDVFSFERELCGNGAVLGGSVMTFGGLFRAVATAAGSPPAAELTPAQRLRAVSVAVENSRGRLGPLRRSSGRSGFAASLERTLDELQEARLDAKAVEAGAATLEGSAYLGDLVTLFRAYEEVRSGLRRTDEHEVARDAIRLLGEPGARWWERPVFVYGVDDLTGSQFELVRLLSTVGEVTIALSYEEGREALAARSALVTRLREDIGVAATDRTEPNRENTVSDLLFRIERGFAVADAEPRAPDESLVLLRSAGERGEAEAIAATVGRLLHDGARAEEIAIVLRDPARRGSLLARVLESYGVAVALEAELPVATTGVGGALLALLEAEFGTRRAADLLRWLRGPSGITPGKVDWFERTIRRNRMQTAAEALERWEERNETLPHDLRRLREAPAAELAAEVGEAAKRMVARFLRRDGDGPAPQPRDGTELRAAATISNAMAELSALDGLTPGATELIRFLRALSFRVWSGPVEGRVRIADPRRLRAARFDHVVIGALQDGEFPRRGGGDPFLSDAQRESLGLDPRRDDDAEERYLFYTSLSLARKSLVLSYRDSDETGAAQTRSPLIDDVRSLLEPAPPTKGEDPVETAITRSRGLADLVHPIAAAPSGDELARSVAARAGNADTADLLDAAAPKAETRRLIEARIAAAKNAEGATMAPGPLANPAVISRLRSVPAYGGTTLEGFDVCSYRWFAGHELRPKPLDPTPDSLLQGSLMHRVLERLYDEKPGGDPAPRPASLVAWIDRGRALVAEEAIAEGLGGQPVERAIRRSVERLLARFLSEESERDAGAFEPWLLEAKFGEDEESRRPALEIDGWLLHGAIDRIDRAPDGRALVHDYKLASRASPARKLEEEAKLQLQLYQLAANELWDMTPIGALYHPLRATRERRPRGVVLEDAAGDLSAYGLVGTDILDREEFTQLLDEARERAGRIVSRMRSGDIKRDPGPRPGLKNHDVCPTYCDFAPICRRDRTPVADEDREQQEEQ